MPPVPDDFFIHAVAETVRANAAFVPPMGKGSFYLRPLLMGTGPILGLGPAPHYEFVVFGAAVGAYFKVSLLPPRPEADLEYIIPPWSILNMLYLLGEPYIEY